MTRTKTSQAAFAGRTVQHVSGRSAFQALAATALCSAVMLATGCSYTRVTVQERLVGDLKGERSLDADVTRSTVSPQLLAGIKTISVRMPDSCQPTTPATVLGKNISSDRIVESACHIWLSEIERAFINGGYKVVSWDAVAKTYSQTVGQSVTLTTENLTASAKALGVDGVVVVNGIDAGPMRTGGFIQNYKFEAADDRGQVKGATALKLRERYQMIDQLNIVSASRIRRILAGQTAPTPEEQIAEARYEEAMRTDAQKAQYQGTVAPNVTALGAALDATLIAVPSGEVAMLHRQVALDLNPLGNKEGFLFEKGLSGWALTLPKPDNDLERRLDEKGDSVEVKFDLSAAENYIRRRLELVQNLASEFVSRLKK